ncbi:MAG: Thioesterase [Bacteroidota bacterium]|nr:Thioesterase [Bacteroidota bacterium]
MKAILLHHAGGDKYAFNNLKKNLAADFECLPIELPGRGNRYNELLIKDFGNALNDYFYRLKNELQQDYFFVGVSMGAVFAYELTHLFLQQALPLPHYLFLASRRSEEDYEDPQVYSYSSPDKLWKHVLSFDQNSEKIAEHPELSLLFEPILRADFAIIEDYNKIYEPKKTLPVPASVMYGKNDFLKNDRKTAGNWQRHFVPEIDVKKFDGGHFFLYENSDAANYIKQTMKVGKR